MSRFSVPVAQPNTEPLEDFGFPAFVLKPESWNLPRR